MTHVAVTVNTELCAGLGASTDASSRRPCPRWAHRLDNGMAGGGKQHSPAHGGIVAAFAACPC
eukprot:9451575-Alexandrium_andersonii.AAC.1